jgi:voltage-gated potassium channel
MTVITISTVGYREAVPLSPAGKGFTIALIVSGVGAALYFLAVVGESVLEGRLRDIYRRGAMVREINRMQGHVIVCGFGRFGRIVVQDLQTAGAAVVVIEQDPSLEAELESEGLPYVLGSATHDPVLEQAGIRNARAIVVAVSSESDCIFITLAARELSPNILINARSESEAAVRRIRQAGANHVTSPLKIGGGRAAMSILRPTVVDFLDLSSAGVGEEIDLEEIRVEAGASIDGTSVGELEAASPQVRIVGLKRSGDSIRIMPDQNEPIGDSDHLVVIGSRRDLAEMALRAQGRSS